LTLTNVLRESEKVLKSKIPTKDKLVEISEIITMSLGKELSVAMTMEFCALSKADLLLNFANTSLGRERKVKKMFYSEMIASIIKATKGKGGISH
jgi:hypothetical protein